MGQKRVQLPLPKSSKDASTQISEVVFMCEYCLATFPTGTDLLDHKYEDHNVGDDEEADEFVFFNQSIFEDRGQSRRKPKARLARTRTPNQTPPIAASSNSSANQVTAASTLSIAPTPAPALANRQELGSHLPRQSELVQAPSANPEISYSCEVCHQACKSKFDLSAHQCSKHYYTSTCSKKSSANDSILANNIVKRVLRSNGDSKIQSKISETPEVNSHEAKVTFTKTKADEAQVKAVPEKASTFRISSKSKTIVKREFRSNSDSKIQSKISETPEVNSHEAKVTSTKTKVDEAQVKAVPEKASTFQISSKPKAILDSNSKLKPLFACKICQKLFTQNSNRRCHEKNVHRGNNIEKCLQCSIPFTPLSFRKHKNGCDSKFNSTSTPQLNTPLQPNTGPKRKPSSTPGISTQVSLGSDKTGIDDDSETDYESADDRDDTNPLELETVLILTPTRPPVALISGPDSKTDLKSKFEVDEASQSQKIYIGKLGDNFDTAVKISSIILKVANDKN